ncbi:PREDICTED: uncharacterized protein LOC105562800, partial [Vollenhovia emeryi]|uniref:uncharacterized protein LOC105562800 n=1 Tax=Vollenhovia emeryi TaxID=411798 RepID=UPI0005F3D4E3
MSCFNPGTFCGIVNERINVSLGDSEDTKRRKSVRKKGRDAKQKRPLDSSSEEEENLLREKKDGRGRPVTTGKGVEMAARKMANKALNKMKGEMRDMEVIMQGDYDPLQYEGAERKKRMRELEEQIPQLPTCDLVAKVMDFSSKIDQAAKKSKNLKRTIAGLIRDGALYTRVAVDALSMRVAGVASEREERMREELVVLRAQVADLQREKEERDRATMPPPGLPRTMRDSTPTEEIVREEEMPEAIAAELPMESPPPGEIAVAAPAEKRTWDVVTPNNADTSRASTSGVEKTRARRKERSVSRKRTKPSAPAKNSSLPSPHAPQKAGKSPPRKAETMGEMVERKIREAVDRSHREIDRRLQKLEDLLQALAGGGQTQEPEETGSSRRRETKPSPQPAARVETYAKVVGRKSRVAEGKSAKGVPRAAAPVTPLKGRGGGLPKKTPKRRLPRTSAVVLTRPNGDYREALARLRREVNLEDLGIGGLVNIRSGATGAKVIEVSGEGHANKADFLAEQVKRVLQGEDGTRVDRPRRMAEVRLRGLDDSLDVEEIKGWVAEAGHCGVSDVQCGALQPAAG